MQTKQKFKAYYFDYFDTATTIVGYEKNQADFDAVCDEIKAQLDFYHKQYTIYNSYDGINNICALNKLHNGVHKELVVDGAIIDLILYCKEMHNKTDGKLNIAMGSVLKIWHQYRNAGMKDEANAQLPPVDKLQEASKHTDIEKVIINEENKTVFISDPKVTLDVGAVAKGYAVERVAQYLTDKGITSYLLNVDGKRVTKFACVDGPDFNGYEVDFDEAMSRGTMYRDFERHAYEEHCNLFKKQS